MLDQKVWALDMNSECLITIMRQNPSNHTQLHWATQDFWALVDRSRIVPFDHMSELNVLFLRGSSNLNRNLVTSHPRRMLAHSSIGVSARTIS